MSKMPQIIGWCLLAALCVTTAGAQTTEFSYQGSLKDGANAATGTYDFEFLLFDALSGGTQLGMTQTGNGIAVAGGVFGVKLNFGPQFPGSDRYLQIRVRLAGQPTFTTLTPRQRVDSAPYSIRSLGADTAASATNAASLGGVAAAEYVITNDTRLSDARNPLPGSGSYVQNTTSPQMAGNFNVTGSGTAGSLSAGVVNADTQFNIAGSRVLKVGTTAFPNLYVGHNTGTNTTTGDGNAYFGTNSGANTTTGTANSFFGMGSGQSITTGGYNAFFGFNSGASTVVGGGNAFFGVYSGVLSTGDYNSFFGSEAGSLSTTGSGNSYFGDRAGYANGPGEGNSAFGKHAGQANTGNYNSFFGLDSGTANTIGFYNAFFGAGAGFANTTGSQNSLFGLNAGASNTEGNGNTILGASAGLFNSSGSNNLFAGTSAGQSNTTGNSNVFLGQIAGQLNTTGSSNTMLGIGADVSSGNLTNATAIGAGAIVATSNAIVLGNSNTKVGIGTSSPTYKLEILNPAGSGLRVATSGGPGIGEVASFGGEGHFYIDAPGIIGGRFAVLQNGNVGIGTAFPTTKFSVNGSMSVSGTFSLASIGGGGSLTLCRNESNLQIAVCSSSLRYKKHVRPFGIGLSVVKRLRPITFNWKASEIPDLGLGAEDVAAIEPLLVTYNAKGEVEGVKYDRIGIVLVNAVQEQQTQIESQRAKIASLEDEVREQRSDIASLRAYVCAKSSEADFCPKKK